MKIYECIEQLEHTIKIYNKLSDINRNMVYKIPYKIDDLNINDMEFLIKQVFKSFSYIPKDLNDKIMSCFNFSEVIDLEINYIEEILQSIIKMVDPSLLHNFQGKLYKLSNIKDIENQLLKLKLILDFINENLNNTYTCKYINLKDIYKSYINAREILVDYMNSLEVPTIPDYEVK